LKKKAQRNRPETNSVIESRFVLIEKSISAKQRPNCQNTYLESIDGITSLSLLIAARIGICDNRGRLLGGAANKGIHG
jgi:hypothetical protein